MGLKDFIQELQKEDSDVIYSKPKEDPIQRIPPTKITTTITTTPVKQLQPEESKPKVIKFKFKQPEITPKEPKVETQNNSDVVIAKPRKNTVQNIVIPPKSTKETNIVENPVVKPEKKVDEQQKKVANEVDLAEELFIKSDTDISLKSIWMEYYNKAIASKKDNFMTRKCKAGRFTITENQELVLLSDYDTHDKSTLQILNDKWF